MAYCVDYIIAYSFCSWRLLTRPVLTSLVSCFITGNLLNLKLLTVEEKMKELISNPLNRLKKLSQFCPLCAKRLEPSFFWEQFWNWSKIYWHSSVLKFSGMFDILQSSFLSKICNSFLYFQFTDLVRCRPNPRKLERIFVCIYSYDYGNASNFVPRSVFSTYVCHRDANQNLNCILRISKGALFKLWSLHLF